MKAIQWHIMLLLMRTCHERTDVRHGDEYGMEHGFMVYPDNTTSDIITGSNDRLTFRFSRELQYTFHTHPKEYKNQPGEVGSYKPSPNDKVMVNKISPGSIHILGGYDEKEKTPDPGVIQTILNHTLVHYISFYNQKGSIEKYPFDRFIKNMRMIWENK